MAKGTERVERGSGAGYPPAPAGRSGPAAAGRAAGSPAAALSETSRGTVQAAIRAALGGAMPSEPPAAPGADTPGGQGATVSIHPELPAIDAARGFGATLALDAPPRFTAWEYLDAVNEVLEGTGATAVFDPASPAEARALPRFSLRGRRSRRPPRAIVRINGIRVLLAGSDEPAFRGDVAEARVNPALWPAGVARLAASRGHVIVADAHPAADPDDFDLAYDRAVAVTVAAAAVLLLAEPCGIVWHPAGNATPAEVIPDFLEALAGGVPPLPLWLRWLPLPPGPGHAGGAASRGLAPLLGRELEVFAFTPHRERTVAHLFEIAGRQLRRGRLLADGAEVRLHDGERYVAIHAERGALSGLPVVRLTPVTRPHGARGGAGPR